MVPDLDIVDSIKASSMAVFDGSLFQKSYIRRKILKIFLAVFLNILKMLRLDTERTLQAGPACRSCFLIAG